MIAFIKDPTRLTWALAATLGAVLSDRIVVAKVFREFRTVCPLVVAGSLGGDRSVRCAVCLLAVGNNHHL